MGLWIEPEAHFLYFLQFFKNALLPRAVNVPALLIKS